MSLAFEKLKPVKVPDPRINLKTNTEYLFKQGANVVSYKTYNSNSQNASSANYKCQPPNPNIIVSSLVYLDFSPTLSFECQVAPNANPAAFAAAPDTGLAIVSHTNGTTVLNLCPRQFPISSIIKTATIKINTDSTSVALNDYIHALSRYYADDNIRAYDLSSCPAMPDMYQKYVDGSNINCGSLVPPQTTAVALVANNAGRNLGDARNPLALFGFNTNEQPRGAYLPISASNVGDVTNATYRFIEPLFVSPLSNGNYNAMGLSQIQTFDVDLSFDSNLPRMFCGYQTFTEANGPLFGGTKFINFSVDLKRESKIHFIYLTPQITFPLPDVLIYDFHQFDRFSTDYQDTIAGFDPTSNAIQGASANDVITNTIQLSCIPNKIYIYARMNNASRNIFTSDTFLRIDKINLDFNGVQGIFSGADSFDLWRMSCDNGLRMGFDEWYYYSGSVLCIDPSKNMGLGSQQSSGMNGTYNFSCSLTLTNLNTQDLVGFSVYTVVDYAGTFTISNQQVIKQIGIVTPRDVLEADDVKTGDAIEIERMQGSSFMTGMKQLHSNVRSVVKKAAPYVEKALPIIDKASDYLGDHPKVQKALKTGVKAAASLTPLLLAAGYDRDQIAKMHNMGMTKKQIQGLLKGQGAVGGDYRNIIGLPTGGAALPRSKLQERALNYNYL